MNEMLDKFLRGIVTWFNDLNILQILLTIVVSYLLCKVTGPVIGWLTRHLIKGPRSETNLAKMERLKRSKTLADLFSFIIKTLIIVTAVYSVLTE